MRPSAPYEVRSDPWQLNRSRNSHYSGGKWSNSSCSLERESCDVHRSTWDVAFWVNSTPGLTFLFTSHYRSYVDSIGDLLSITLILDISDVNSTHNKNGRRNINVRRSLVVRWVYTLSLLDLRNRATGGSICLSLIHIWRCRRLLTCRSRWSPYH